VEALASRLILAARRRSGLTQAQLAELADTSQPAVAAYESGARQPTTPTLVRLLRAAGFEPEVVLQPSVSTEDAAQRAATLEQLLDLADHLPQRHAPRLPRRGFAAIR
jgi:transcriptional regulator with XRE-family HTH domain